VRLLFGDAPRARYRWKWLDVKKVASSPAFVGD
jgi:hypothetical protein